MAMTLRLSEQLDADLTRAATAAGISKQEAVTRAIEEFLHRGSHQALVTSAIAETLSDHAELLDKLSRT